MKKRVIGLFLAGILAASALVGCGGGSSAESTDAGATEEAAAAGKSLFLFFIGIFFLL